VEIHGVRVLEARESGRQEIDDDQIVMEEHGDGVRLLCLCKHTKNTHLHVPSAFHKRKQLSLKKGRFHSSLLFIFNPHTLCDRKYTLIKVGILLRYCDICEHRLVTQSGLTKSEVYMKNPLIVTNLACCGTSE